VRATKCIQGPQLNVSSLRTAGDDYGKSGCNHSRGGFLHLQEEAEQVLLHERKNCFSQEWAAAPGNNVGRKGLGTCSERTSVRQESRYKRSTHGATFQAPRGKRGETDPQHTAGKNDVEVTHGEIRCTMRPRREKVFEKKSNVRSQEVPILGLSRSGRTVNDLQRGRKRNAIGAKRRD